MKKDVNIIIKIGICGCHGAGKSTKAKELRDHYAAIGNIVVVVDEVARSCPLPLGTVLAQEWIWYEQMRREKAAMAFGVDIIITDRTVLDNLMYYFDLIPDDDPKAIQRWRDLYQEAVAWMPSYNQVIRLPLNLEYLKADDPIRPKSIEYACRIDALFSRFVQPYITKGGDP